MKYGDFSSIVQLGVGLHAGTALLQLYGEIGIAPLLRTIDRIRNLLSDDRRESSELWDEFDLLIGKFDIFKIRLFNEYKRYTCVNFGIAASLAILLVVIGYKADDAIATESTIFVVALSLLPGPSTLAALWLDASAPLRRLRLEADDLELRTLRSGKPPSTRNETAL